MLEIQKLVQPEYSFLADVASVVFPGLTAYQNDIDFIITVLLAFERYSLVKQIFNDEARPLPQSLRVGAAIVERASDAEILAWLKDPRSLDMLLTLLTRLGDGPAAERIRTLDAQAHPQALRNIPENKRTKEQKIEAENAYVAFRGGREHNFTTIQDAGAIAGFRKPPETLLLANVLRGVSYPSFPAGIFRTDDAWIYHPTAGSESLHITMRYPEIPPREFQCLLQNNQEPRALLSAIADLA
ncbi:MAG: hypothetical protein ACRER2_15340 [Methylococcales bacterium]